VRARQVIQRLSREQQPDVAEPAHAETAG
jgi:hypothetical protein